MEVNDMEEKKLPLGLIKQAILKMESALTDLREIIEDEDIEDDDKDDFVELAEYSSNIIAVLYNKVNDDEDFIKENVKMDEIGTWPGELNDIMENEIE